MNKESLEFSLQKNIGRRQFLKIAGAGAAIGFLNACGISTEDNPSTNNNCSTNKEKPLSNLENRQFLSDKELETLGIKVFDLSSFPGQIRLTKSFNDLITPLVERDGKLRIIWVDDTPNNSESILPPFDNLANLTDDEILFNKEKINRLRPNRTSECDQGLHINNFCSDSVGLTFPAYRLDLNCPKFQPIITILVSIKDSDIGYENLLINSYKTYPELIDQFDYARTILGRFLHEMSHVKDFANYQNDSDPQIIIDYNPQLGRFEKPGEIRADSFANEQINLYKSSDQLPPIVIFGPDGKMLKNEVKSLSNSSI